MKRETYSLARPPFTLKLVPGGESQVQEGNSEGQPQLATTSFCPAGTGSCTASHRRVDLTAFLGFYYYSVTTLDF
jgi:hypothetical protein